ncbi:MAG: PEP-CTERM sorting domain-containing protein [Planctomycetota bacterium]|jgi:hypothetical protein
MKKSKRIWLVCHMLLALVTGTLVESTYATIADFENFSEGFCASSFTDPDSGMFFYDLLDIDNAACIEYVGPSANRNIFSDTNYLTGSGYSPGDGASLGYNFGFTADLGLAADFVSVDVFFSNHQTNGTLTLNGYNNGNLVKTETLLFSGFHNFEETTISIEAPLAEITRIEVIPDGMFTGYDNVTAVPEPTTFILLGLGGLVLKRKR